MKTGALLIFVTVSPSSRKFLEQLMSGFEISPNEVVLVPGNHDVSWLLSQSAYHLQKRQAYLAAHAGKEPAPGTYIQHGTDVLEVRDEALYRERFQPFSKLYRSVVGKDYPVDYAEQALVTSLPDAGLCFLGLNSAWEIDHVFKDRASINMDALSRALLELGPDPKGMLRIAVFHHPIDGGEDSRIRDTAFLQQLAVHGFRLILHGHVHKADSELYRYDKTADGRRIDVIAAGTFGAPIREWVPGYPLEYNLLLLSPERVTVETRGRREVNGAWGPEARWGQGAGLDPLPRYYIEL